MATNNTQNNGSATSRLNMRLTLILFALIPLIVTSLTIGIISISKSKKEIKTYTHDSLVQVIDAIGTSFDAIIDKNQESLKAYATAPILKQYLQDPSNAELAAAAQQYTLDFFGSLDG